MVLNFSKSPISPRTLAVRLSYVEISNFFRASSAVNVNHVSINNRRPTIQYQASPVGLSENAFKRCFSQLRALRAEQVDGEPGYMRVFKRSCECRVMMAILRA